MGWGITGERFVGHGRRAGVAAWHCRSGDEGQACEERGGADRVTDGGSSQPGRPCCPRSADMSARRQGVVDVFRFRSPEALPVGLGLRQDAQLQRLGRRPERALGRVQIFGRRSTAWRAPTSRPRPRSPHVPGERVSLGRALQPLRLRRPGRYNVERRAHKAPRGAAGSASASFSSSSA
jgi:hypothetical protein